MKETDKRKALFITVLGCLLSMGLVMSGCPSLHEQYSIPGQGGGGSDAAGTSPTGKPVPGGGSSGLGSGSLKDSDGDGISDSDEAALGTNPNNPDSDGDGLSDWDEVNKWHTDPNDPDADGEGLTDGDEVNKYHTDPTKEDTDEDGWDDKWEIDHGTDPNRKDVDTDEDGLPDDYERSIGTDPHNPDTDGDGYGDGWEVDHGYNPLDSDDPGKDSDDDKFPDDWEDENGYDKDDPNNPNPGGDDDGDGLTNQEEFDHGTDPKKADTDGDGLPDGWEVRNGLDPKDSTGDNGWNGDPDKDGLTNGEEYREKTNPKKSDTDGDGFKDGWEVTNRYDPLDPNDPAKDGDDDGDYLSNWDEYIHGTDPKKVDTDGDGFIDGWEVTNDYDPLNPNDPAKNGDDDGDGLTNEEEHDHNTNPKDRDTDGDGYNDRWEVTYGGITVGGHHLDPVQDDRDWLPHEGDEDGDGVTNKREEETGTNPFDPADFIAADNLKQITGFTITSPVEVAGIINETAKTITVTVPYGTSLIAMTASVNLSPGATISPDPETPMNYTGPVLYVVTAKDGSYTYYSVTVNPAPSNTAKMITEFKFANPSATGIINGTVITVNVPYGTNLTKLTPIITYIGKSINPSSGVEQDFTNSVKYRVTAEDNSFIDYTVTVNPGLNEDAKEITAFRITDPVEANGIINGTNITVTVPPGTPVTSMTTSISHTGASIQPESGMAMNFTNPVPYRVTASNGSHTGYSVTVQVAQESAKEITEFAFPGLNATGNIEGTAIAVTVPSGTDLAALTPTITHTGKSISPESGAVQNFTLPKTYTVTAEDGSSQNYTVTVTVAPSSAKAITEFKFTNPSAVGQINGTAITVEVPYGTVVTGLIPTITYTGSSISPLSGQAQNFSNPKTYTVTAADNSTQDYTVTVNVAQGNAKAITEFKIASPSVTGTINGTAITVTVPYGTNVTSLIPTITHTGASVDPESGTAQDFSSPKIYTVRAADNSIQEYTVTVTAEKNNAKAITAFNFTSPNVTGTVNESAKTVTLNVPYETVVTSLTPTITVSAGATVSPESGTATNFTNPVTYTVTAENGDTQAYTVTVNKALNSAKAITAFKFTSPNVTGTVNETEKTIAINVPYGTSVTSLTPTITYTGASVSPASGTATNFTNPVTYTVTAADGSTQDYTVTVTVAKNSAKKITAFSITNPVNKTGTVNESAKTVTINDVPYGTVVTAMIPSITVSAGATVSPTSGTATNFTNPVTYTVTAADGSTQDYKVTVNVAKNSAKDITAFNIGGASGSINGTAITVTVSYQTTSVTSLIPTITVSPGATVYPTSGTATDFTNPVTYTVWAEDGTSKDYTVTVTVGSPPALKRPITEAVAGVTFKLGYVERGSFVHGSGNTVDNLTTITTSYWMGETEVTQALYQAVMGNNPSYFTGSPAAGETQGNRPVEQVYWYHAIAFCNLLSLALGYTPVYSVNGVNWSTLTYAEIPWDTDPDWDAVTVNYNVQGYRLPTEAEWGWAAMGGAEGLVTVYNMNGYSEAFAGSYSGADVNNYAWTSNNSGSKTHEVKKKLPNKIGLYDMTGNVGEWVYDWYGTYPTGSRTDPRGPDSGEYRMFCSGAWDFAPYQCSFSWRTNYMRPRFNDSSVGLRVILPDPGR